VNVGIYTSGYSAALMPRPLLGQPTPVPVPSNPTASISSALAPLTVPYIAAWWDASDESTVTLNGGNISQIIDKSGRGNHLTQATANAQPLYARNAVNGRNAMTYSTTNHRLVNTAMTIDRPSVFSVFRVRSGYTLAFNVAPIIWDNFQPANRIVHYPAENTTNLVFSRDDGAAGKVASRSIAFGTVYVSCCRSEQSAGHSVFVNGVKGTDATAGTTGFSGISIGNIRGNPTPAFTAYNFDGQLCEFVVYANRLTDAQRVVVERYLGAKWGVTVA